MNTIKFNERDAFVAALESRRGFWRDVDKRTARDHKAVEDAWLKGARAKMREAMKWDYETLKGNLDWSRRLGLGEKVEDCPKLWEPRLDAVLAALNLTAGKVFNVSSEGVWREAHLLLTHDPYAPRTVC